MRVVVAGASGFVGSRVVPALRQAGHEVICGSRRPKRARALSPARTWVRLDVDDAGCLDAALSGADALVYLVHQMDGSGADLLARERASALRVRKAAEKAGVGRIVYLGAPMPTGSVSTHIEARMETGRVLRGGTVSTIELQAAMIIGYGSESWLITRDLAVRLPVMVLPRWLERCCQPIGIDDVVHAILTCLTLPTESSMCLSLPGPETLATREILYRVSAHRGFRPLAVRVPVLTPGLSSRWIQLVTRADTHVARHLVHGLTSDLIAKPPFFWEHSERTPTPLDDAIAAALREEPSVGLRARIWEGLARRVGKRLQPV